MIEDSPNSSPIRNSRTRMLITLGVMLFAGFLLATTVSYLISRNSIRQSILKNDLPLSSNNIYSEIQRDLFEPILISSLMANDTFVKDWLHAGEKDESAILRYLKHIQQRYKTITSFLVSDATRQYYQADQVLKTVNETSPVDKWFFRVREMNKDYEINVDPDLANQNTMTIFINYRVTESDGRFLAATGVGLSVSSVKALMQEYRTRYHREVYFYNRNGDLVLHGLDPNRSESSEKPHSREILQPIFERVAAGNTDINFSAVGPRGALANFRYIPELDWILVVEQTSDGTEPLFYQALGLNLLVCVITAIILLRMIRQTALRYQRNLEHQNQELQQKNARIEQQAAELASANQELDALHREKDEFIGITVHDLKNPLASVMGFAEFLQQDATVSGNAREYADYIALSSRSMVEQVEELLKLTELEAPAALQMERVDAAEAIRVAAQEYAFHAQAKSILVNLDLSESLHVHANRKWLASTVGNLLSNAIKYSPEHRPVTVRLRAVETEVEIAIQDHGIGIPEAEQPRLFRKFERLSPRPTAGESSSGLGLYLVQQMITRMGGRIRCQSSPGQGSTFTLTLQRAG